MNSVIVKTFYFALVASVTAVPASQQRIIGGPYALISDYPFAAPMLFALDFVNFRQTCVATILTPTTAMSSASCVYGHNVNHWRIRVGSTYSDRGGVVHNISSILIHPFYKPNSRDYDVSLIKTTTPINYVTGAVQPASIAGSNYNVTGTKVVWALGWGTTVVGGFNSNHLRHVQMWTTEPQTCRQRYSSVGISITDSMLCAGWQDVGGRVPCTGDNGSPLMHDNVVVGVYSFQLSCGRPQFSAVYTSVQVASSWIVANA